MEVECAESRHLPYLAGEHAERYDNEEISFQRTQCRKEILRSQFFGLKQGKVFVYGISFDIALIEFMAATGGLIRHSDHSYDVEIILYECIEAFDCEFGSAEKNYLEVFFIHSS